MEWEKLSWSQIKEIPKETVVIFPVAAVEQHGPHLPLMTDAVIAQSIARELDQFSGRPLLILPVQRIGYSQHHMSFPGTLSLSHETFAKVVLEVIEAVEHHGFHRILILNSHGGNQAIGNVIAEKAGKKWPSAEMIFTSWWRPAAERLATLVEGEFPSVGHACEFETSLIMEIVPDLVDKSAMQDDGRPPESRHLQSDLLTRNPSATLSLSFDMITETGIYGKPTLASSEKGQEIMRISVEALNELIDECWSSV